MDDKPDRLERRTSTSTIPEASRSGDLTPCFLLQSAPVKTRIVVYHPDDPTTYLEENTEYADIYIPVPYDPEIPGVRCVDAEEVENADVAMVNTEHSQSQ